LIIKQGILEVTKERFGCRTIKKRTWNEELKELIEKT
jgi:MOSC domain-containing protein YiiM